MANETVWGKTKRYSGVTYNKALKPGFDVAWRALDKLGAPINRLSNKVGAEAFWPTSIDKESEKCARILRSFCKNGFYTKIDEQEAHKITSDADKPAGPQSHQRVLKKIPQRVIQNAKGLAIFTTMRTGLWVSGAGGSGVLIARDQHTGEWSPPSGILLHTAGLGFLVGVDIYDCVIVINTYEALEGFTKIRATIGGEVSAVAGPVGMGGVLESEVHKRQAPVFTYLKSRGFYAGVQVDGTVIIERTDENEAFYGEKIGVHDILAGKARNPPKEKYRMLTNTLLAAQGDPIPDKELPSTEDLTPGDLELDLEKDEVFGVPNIQDPDPYGYKALEEEGIHIREAGSSEQASPDKFKFNPVPTSPLYATFHRGSASLRNSIASVGSVERATQTDEDDYNRSTHDESPGINKSPPPLPARHEQFSYDSNYSNNASSTYSKSTHVPNSPHENIEKGDDIADVHVDLTSTIHDPEMKPNVTV